MANPRRPYSCQVVNIDQHGTFATDKIIAIIIVTNIAISVRYSYHMWVVA
jgi:hypothetical protein